MDHLQGFLKTGDCYPLHMIVGLTDYCNQNCIWCYSDYSTHKNVVLDEGGGHYLNIKKAKKDLIIDSNRLMEIISEAKTEGLKAISLIGSGEPLLHPDFTRILYELQKMKIEVGIYSNGTQINSIQMEAILSCCKFFRFSIDAASFETYQKIHRENADFTHLLENVKRMVREKNKRGAQFPTIGAQFVTNQINYREIVDFVKMMKLLKVQYINYKPMMENPINKNEIIQEMNIEQVIPLLLQAEAYQDNEFIVYTKQDEFRTVINRNRGENAGYNNMEYYKKCYGNSFVSEILANGDMYLCVNLGGRRDSLIGNIYKNGLKEIWNSKRRKEVLKGIDLNKKCPAACRMDPLNRILWDLKHPDPQIHLNFI
jgi:radical SAM protein with 4Fe4S-binding SPASM domain